MTTLNVTLTQALKTELSQDGVYFQVVVVNDHVVDTVQVYSGGTLGPGQLPIPETVSLDLPAELTSGKVYFVIQSVTPGTAAYAITQESDISWTLAATNSFRYDSFEVNLSGAGGLNDVGNLTSVEGFGIPMDLSVPNHTADGTAYTDTRGYAVSGTDIFNLITATSADTTVYPFAQGPLATSPPIDRMGISPTQAVGLTPPNPAFPASDWNTYVQSLQGSAAAEVQLAGFFNGAADANGVYHNGGFFSYTLEWDSAQSVFWLSPTANSQIKGYIKITPTDLENSIYSTLGNVQIYADKSDSDPYIIYKNTNVDGNPADMNTGDNNQWGKVLAQFLTGFTAGYYGVTGQSANSEATTVDLNKNWNWDPTYAFGSNLSDGQTPIRVDEYSKLFFYNSNSYGSGYSDALMSQYSVGGPLISVYDPFTSNDVANINLTLYADGETPSGYVAPKIYNYIAAPGGSNRYTVPVWDAATSLSSVTLNFLDRGVVLGDQTPIYFKILTGYDGSGNPIWNTVQLGSDTVSPWQHWSISYSNGAYQVTSIGTEPTGSLLIDKFPTSVSGTSWYEIVVGSEATAKTFNLYIDTNASGQFEDGAGDIAIDGLATIAAGAANTSPNSLLTFTVNFVDGDTTTYDPSLAYQLNDASYAGSAPNAPVAGTLDGSTFTAIAGQSNQITNSIVNLGQGEIAFAWTGDNSDAGTTSWISGLTNKINGLNVALLNITPTTGDDYFAPLAAQADVDGQWKTNVMQQFGNGTYNITMTEYDLNDSSFSNPLTAASSLLTIQVNMADLHLQSTTSGTGVQLTPGPSTTTGNWIALDTVSSSLPPDATLMLYATDASGTMLGRDGAPTTNLEDAVLGYVGAVKSDQGASTLIDGHQMVYLGVDQQLHFALMSGENVIDTSPVVQVTNESDGSVHLNVGGVEMTAVTENTLSNSEVLANVQRMYDLPLVYLQQGEAFDVQATGSSANTNTLGFVHFDINFATGEVSVGGVAYGDTPAFQAAVRANLDAGYTSADGQHGGAAFDTTSVWTVAGTDGFYAPVLLTQSGDLFVVGDANTGGNEYIRTFGANTFGFEDLSSLQGSDFDYNDMVMKITPHTVAPPDM